MSNKEKPSFNPKLKEVHTLHTNLLVSNGWARIGSTYTKGKDKIVFDGVHWTLNEKTRIQFLEDIPPDDDQEIRDYYETLMNIP